MMTAQHSSGKTMFKRMSALAVATALSITPALAEIQTVHGDFKTEHGATTHPHGSFEGKLDTDTHTLTYHFHYAKLSGPVNAIHLHGPADDGQDAGVLVPVEGPYKTHMKGRLTLTPDQIKDVQDGKTYINLHTEKYAEGEARAQLTVK